jgi:GDP-L-fucose synthase
MEKTDRIFVAGADTLIGLAVLKALRSRGYDDIVGDGTDTPNLTDFAAVNNLFGDTHPDYVFVTGGKSGGIEANRKYPADLMLDNLLTISNVLRSAHTHGVKKLLYLASSCCYPRECPQPMRVEYLMTGPFEPTNEAYASAKLAGLSLCGAFSRQYGSPFISAIPANVFGPGDDFDPQNSHVIAALIRKMHESKRAAVNSVEVWGSGIPEREFIFSDDLADACLFLMDRYEDATPINIGAESLRFSIKELAFHVKKVVGYTGDVHFNTARPDGMPRKTLDSMPLQGLGWFPKTDFAAALLATYESYLQLERREVSHA